MGIAAGPNVPRDGLALWYDFSSVKSFRGEPTTNLVDPSWASWGVDSSGFGTTGTRTILSTYHCRIQDINSNTRQSIYIEGINANTTYTFSVQYLRLSGAPTLRFQIQAYNSGTYLSTMSFATTSQLGITDSAGWQTASITLTTPTSTNRILWFMQDGDDYVGYTHAFELRNVQLEQKAYPTPFVVGTRGTTVASGGGVIDLSGNGSSGELVNGVTASASFGGMVMFDGTNDHIRAPSISATSVSVAAWVRSSSWSTQTHPMIVAKGINVEWILWKSDDAGNDENFGWRSGGGSTIYSTTTAQNNVWYHLLATVGAAGMRLYVNGVLEASNGTTSVPSGSLDICVGAGVSGNSVANLLFGSVRGVQVWKRQLSATEVLQNYNASRVTLVERTTIVSSGLVLHLDAANRDSYRGSGTTWSDLSGFGNTGTLTNGPVFRTGNGGHLLFDGVNDYVDIGNQSTMSFTNGIFTVEALIHVSRTWTGGSQYPNLLSKGATSGWDTDGWSLFVFRDWPNAGQYSWGVGLRNNSPTPTTNIVARYAFAPDTYIHICAVMSGSGTTITLYENGSQVSTGSQTINPASNSTSVLIARDNNGTSYPGRIAYVRVYGRALTAAEVLQNYNATRGRFGL